MSDALYTEAAGFDDEALAALASRGLVRRAVKLRGEAQVDLDGEASGAADDALTVTVGDEVVMFAAGTGVANGRCTCPTVGPCQHLLAAIMTLRDAAPADARARPAADGEEADDRPGLVAWVLSIEDDELRRFVGLPALRWALARVDETADAEIIDGDTCVVRPVPGIEVRFMGPALASAFCSPAGSNDRRNIALAVLATRAQHGAALPQLERTAAERGRGAVRGGEGAAGQLLAGVASAVADTVGTGIAHPSAAMRERFDSLAVDARGIGLHRVGQLAARVEGHLDEAITLQAAADAGQLLADLALLHLVSELSVSSLGSGELPRWLQGVARAEYSRVATFEALGLGAMPWVTRSGYAGMTGVLFDLDNRRFVEVSSARRSESVDTSAQYKALIGWSSNTSLASLSGKRVQIAGALLSPTSRLSVSNATTSQTIDSWEPSELEVCEWDGSVPEPVSRLRGGTSARWAVVKVDEADRARYDEVNQRLMWPIRSRGRDLDVVLYWQPHLEIAVEALERRADRKVSHVVGRLAATAGGTLVLTPVSVVVGQQLRVLAVDRASSRQTGRRRARKGLSPSTTTAEASAGVAAVERLGGKLVAFAERGVDSTTDDDLAQVSRLAADIGCVSIARVLTADQLGTRERILRAVHLVEEHRAATDIES